MTCKDLLCQEDAYHAYLAFERVGQAFGRVGQVFERVHQAFERVHQAFERVGQAFERVHQAFERVYHRLASHSLFSDWTGAGEKGLVTLGHSLCLYQNLGRDYSLIFPRDSKIA